MGANRHAALKLEVGESVMPMRIDGQLRRSMPELDACAIDAITISLTDRWSTPVTS
jgi:hypothetical protein